MTKKRYTLCEDYWRKLKELPEFETLKKSSNLLKDGGYWGPEAEDRISPDDINLDVLKEQMKLFLERFGSSPDVSSLSFQDLVKRFMNEPNFSSQNSNDSNDSSVG